MSEEMSEGKSRGQIAYEGWAQGLPGCEWGNQTRTQMRAWELAAEAVVGSTPASSAPDKLELAVAALERIESGSTATARRIAIRTLAAIKAAD